MIRIGNCPGNPDRYTGVLSGGYLCFTFGGGSVVTLCAALAVLDAAFRRQTRGRAGDVIAYASGLVGVLLALQFLLSFHIVARFLDARGLQTLWREGPTYGQWFMLNSIEFFLSLGPVLTSLAMAGIAVGLCSLGEITYARTFSLAVAGTFVLLGAFGSNSEVYRLWAFFGLAFVPAVVLATQLLGLHLNRLLGVAALITHLLWLLPFASHYGHLPP